MLRVAEVGNSSNKKESFSDQRWKGEVLLEKAKVPGLQANDGSIKGDFGIAKVAKQKLRAGANVSGGNQRTEL
jgi:hypothetical protein